MCYTLKMINEIGIQINEGSAQIGIDQCLENFICREPDRTTLGFAFHTVSVTTIQLCRNSAKKPIHNTSMNDHGCVYGH